MTHREAPILLNLNIDPIGHHHAAWRHPDTDPRKATDFDYYVKLARRAERAGGIASVFIADGLAHRIGPATVVLPFEPVSLFSAIASRTKRIGVILTISSSFSEPFTTARQLASLDHLSGGRSGINIVTSTGDAAARNYGLDRLPDHAARYARAEEFVETLLELWNSWDGDALEFDQESGVFVHEGAVRAVNHDGAFFRVEGPLNTPRVPQGRPVIVQAGSSEHGRAFASRHADVVYTINQSIDDARDFYGDIKARTSAHGRDPDEIKVLLGVRVLVDPSASVAERKRRELNDLLPYAHKLAGISRLVGVDLGALEPDDPIPTLPEPHDGHHFQTQLVMLRALVSRGEVHTVGQLADRLDGGQGVSSVTGAPGDIADHLEEWFDAGAADGFTILPQITQTTAPVFLDEVIPELRRRGRLLPEPDEVLLSTRLGLPSRGEART